MTIELEEGVISNRAGGGPSLYYASAMPRGGAKAWLSIVHGYADHGARYAHVMGALAEHGVGSVAVDLRGHGRAQGRRGFCKRFGEFLEDAGELDVLVQTRAKGAPVFLFGHSFGGLVATLSILSAPSVPYRGLLLSAPFFGLGRVPPRLKLMAGRVASRLYPTLSFPSDLEGRDMTHDLVRATAYDNDPLVFKTVTARWFTEAVAAQRQVLSSASRVTLPLTMVVGASDTVASVAAARRFFDAAASSDKTWDARAGQFHEVLNEISWKETVDSLARWILARSSA